MKVLQWLTLSTALFAGTLGSCSPQQQTVFAEPDASAGLVPCLRVTGRKEHKRLTYVLPAHPRTCVPVATSLCPRLGRRRGSLTEVLLASASTSLQRQPADDNRLLLAPTSASPDVQP